MCTVPSWERPVSGHTYRGASDTPKPTAAGREYRLARAYGTGAMGVIDAPARQALAAGCASGLAPRLHRFLQAVLRKKSQDCLAQKVLPGAAGLPGESSEKLDVLVVEIQRDLGTERSAHKLILAS